MVETSLRARLLAQAEYMESGCLGTGVPATIETDSDVWRTSIQLLREAADQLLCPPSPRYEEALEKARIYSQHYTEAQRSTAALLAALEQIAQHDGERFELDADGLPTVYKNSPQEIATKALAPSTETP